MESDNLGNLLTKLAEFLDKYYYYAIACGILFTVLIVFSALKLRLKIMNKVAGKPENSSDSKSMIMSFLIGSNPAILNKMISTEAKNKEKIIAEIKKFTKINNFKKIDENTVEISAEIKGKEQSYLAKTTKGNNKPQILELNRQD